MLARTGVLSVLVAALAAGCGSNNPVVPTPVPPGGGAGSPAVLVGAGDIADCFTDEVQGTARLLDSIAGTVFTLGDNAYPDGSYRDFVRCFGPSWGDSSKLILRNLHPSPGNHEHQTERAAPYYRYFGRRAGDPDKGYYAYDHGAWRVIVLNSELIVNNVFPPSSGKAQENWLADELRSHANTRCTIAYWHHPRFSSGWHGGDTRLDPVWRLLHEGGVDVVLNGHDHNYERFRPMNPAGTLDTARGIVQFVVGTGGTALRGFRRAVPNSVVRLEGHWGVLKLTLGRDEYRFAFLEPGGRVWDPGGGRCH